MTAAIELRALSVSLGGSPVLHAVDLMVPRGSWTTVIGPNGAGKTTLLRSVLGLVPLDGQAFVFGDDVGSLSRRERAARVALVPQDPVIPLGMTVAHYVLLGRTARLSALARETNADLDAVDAALDHLDLGDLGNRTIETLSGGERQRAVLARALAQEASVLLLDEPTSALDIGHQQEVLDLVDALRRDLGLTVLAAMHDLTLAAHYADSVVLLRDGAIVARGTPSEVLTTDTLRRHYQARIDVIEHHGRLVVVPHPKETTDART